MDDIEYAARQEEADLLAEIGRHLFDQNLRVTVQLPKALAARALAGWRREDAGTPDSNESRSERATRHQAAALALVGLAVEERSSHQGGDCVTVELDAWQIGTALDAANERGMLNGLRPADPRS